MKSSTLIKQKCLSENNELQLTECISKDTSILIDITDHPTIDNSNGNDNFKCNICPKFF